MVKGNKYVRIYSNNIFQNVTEMFSLDFCEKDVPVHLDCRILERNISDRKYREFFHHPEPPFSRLFLLQEGSIYIKMNGKTTELISGTIYLLPAGTPFHVRYEVSKLYFYHIHVSDLSGTSVFSSTDTITRIEDSLLFSSLTEAITGNNKLNLFSSLMELLNLLIYPLMNSIAESSKNALLFEKMFNWLKTQPLASVTVDSIAELYGANSSAFSKRFKRAMGCSLKQYLTTIQIRKAQQQLLYTNDSVSDIAVDLGHKYPEYFHRFFKKHCGCTPAVYRKKMKSD